MNVVMADTVEVPIKGDSKERKELGKCRADEHCRMC